MKRFLSAMLLMLLLCSPVSAENVRCQDGVYRGFYYEDGVEQVAVQFEMKDGLFQSVVLRNLTNPWDGLLDEGAGGNQKEKLSQLTVLCNYLEGKDVAAIDDLYHPEEILIAAGHTPSEYVPYEKLISALWDGINRRPFKLVDTSKLPEADPYPDGVYTGTYREDDGEQIVLELTVRENVIEEIRYLKLSYKGVDYMSADASEAVRQVAGQFQQLIDYLVGKELSCVNDLYLPGTIAEDTDVSSAATLRAPKVISAIWEGLNKNAYIIQ